MTGSDESTGASPFATLYDRAVDSLLDGPVDDVWLDTGDGRTHVLTVGDSDDPPLVVFQGGNVTNPVTLAWVQGLAEDYFLVAPDTPGQPGKSTVEQPQEFGPWVVAVLDEFGLDSARMLGASHGAAVLLEAAVHAPGRIDAAAFLVPAGFGTPISLDLARIVVPSLAYRMVPRGWMLEHALAPLFTQPVSAIDDVVIETIAQALGTGDLAAEFPGPDDPVALADFQAPSLVITAENDPFFPGRQTCKRAGRRLQTLEECILLPDERHFLSPAGQRRATERIRSFLVDPGGSNG